MTNNSDRVVELLEELVTWTRVGMYGEVEQVLSRHFGESRPEERLAYDLLDGERSQAEVVALCKASVSDAKVSPSSLSAWISTWERAGLILRRRTSVEASFCLADFGYDVPTPKIQKE